MKSIIPTSWFMTGLTTVAILATPAAITAIESQPTLLAEEGERQELIRGVVKEITEKELTVTDIVIETKETKFKLSKETKYLKDGKEAKADDVTAGARVAVKAMKDAAGNYEAAEVNVIGTKPLE